jgi:hypothetical protein
MKKPHSIYIHLTNEQAELLKDLFAYVRSEAAKNAPGMLLAQVWDAASFADGSARMRVGFVEHDVAKTVEHAAHG